MAASWGGSRDPIWYSAHFSQVHIRPRGCFHVALLLAFCLLHALLLLLSRFSRVRVCVTPETAAHQAPLSLGFSRQEHWSGLPFPSPLYESEK